LAEFWIAWSLHSCARYAPYLTTRPGSSTSATPTAGEVDILLEFSDGRVAGIEVKASAAPQAHDIRHLQWLRDSLGDQFVAGALVHTGPRALRLDEAILALPVWSLWA
jgi:hypothetical protein